MSALETFVVFLESTINGAYPHLLLDADDKMEEEEDDDVNDADDVGVVDDDGVAVVLFESTKLSFVVRESL